MTAHPALAAYTEALYRCRFCPMCKPAGEVANVTLLESHTTRARGMYLWRAATGIAALGAREVELLYQSTLDSISEAFCVSHYPVSEYVAAARADVFEAGLAPACVHGALSRLLPEMPFQRASTVLVASEAAEWGDPAQIEPALRALHQAGVETEALVIPSGALAYALGARGQARREAEAFVAALRESGATLVVTDGPLTQWALQCLYAKLGVALPDVRVTPLTAQLAAAREAGRIQLGDLAGQRVLVHDCRASALLADQMAAAETVQPGYRGAEEKLGQGPVYELTRALVAATGAERILTTWSRSLARSCGADDGLWLTHPELARPLRAQRLAEARRLGATAVVTDSLLCAAYLGAQDEENPLPVYWLPSLVKTGGAA